MVKANTGRELIDLIDDESDSRLRKSVVHELNIGIVLWPEFPLLSLAGLIDALRHAADRADNSRKLRCSWTIMGSTRGAGVVASCGVEICADDRFLDPRKFHYIALIGGLLQHGPGAARGACFCQASRRRRRSVVGHLYGNVCSGKRRIARWTSGLPASVSSGGI